MKQVLRHTLMLIGLTLMSVSQAQIASTVVRVGEVLPDDPSSASITDITGTTQNQVGGMRLA